jgi:undecaprenyl-diphosphatase
MLVGVCLMITALLLALSEWLQSKRQGNGHEITYRDAIVIGIAQACAVLPGLSRSGSTIATGLLCGVKKENVAHFSFLMVLIPILGEALLDLLKLLQGEITLGVGLVPGVVGFISAFITGCFACRFMIEIVRRQRLVWFALYCAVVGIGTIIYSIY